MKTEIARLKYIVIVLDRLVWPNVKPKPKKKLLLWNPKNPNDATFKAGWYEV